MSLNHSPWRSTTSGSWSSRTAMSRCRAASWIASANRQARSGVSAESSPGAVTRWRRPVVKSETTTRSPEIRTAAPPYSWTRLRALKPSGVRRVIVPSRSRRTRACRPPSSGRPSSHQVTASTPCGSARNTTRSISRSIGNGDAHEPYGATSLGIGRRASSGPVLPGRDVLGLLRRHVVELDAERLELQPGNLGVDRRRHAVDLVLELGVVLHDVLGGKRLVREAHVHDGGGMALGRAEVHEAALRDEV